MGTRDFGLEHACGKMDYALLKEMRSADAALKKFHKPHWYDLARLNNRTHRKLLVVDGTTGFTPGGWARRKTWSLGVTRTFGAGAIDLVAGLAALGRVAYSG